MFRCKLYRKYLGIAVVAALLLFSSSSLRADMSFVGGGGGGGGGGGSPVVTGQNVVNGTGIIRNDASMIAGPVGTQVSNNTATSITAPSFTTDVSNVVVFNVYGTSTTQNSAPALTNLINIAASGGQNMGLWAGYQTLSSAGASGTQTLGFASATGAGVVTIPFIPVSGQTIGVSTSATRLQSATAAGGHNITINVPSATANGDTLLACIAFYPNSPVTALPGSQPSPATGTQRWVNDGAWYGTTTAGNGGIQCWHKVASSEPASYTLTTTATGTGVPAGFIADLTNIQTLDVPMTSATGTFTASNVGNDICIQSADTSFVYQSIGTVGGQGCGQIGAFGSTTKIYPNFGNLSGATISSKQYAYGPDQGAAIQSAITATGGKVVLGSGIYMTCGGNNTSTCLSFPAAPTILEGQGRAGSNWGFAGIAPFGPGTGINNTNLGTYIIIANTDLNQTAWQWNPGANSVANTLLTLTIRDLTLWGGVGTAGDGGGSIASSAAGFTGTNFQWLGMERVIMGNFWGDIVDTTIVGTTGYTDSTHFDRVWFTLSGGGDGWKSVGTGTEAQNEVMIDSEVDNNGHNGIELTGNHDIFDLMGNNIQRNDNFNAGGHEQIFCNGCTAFGVIEGNYFENDSGTQNATVSVNATGWAGTDWRGNFSIGASGFYPQFAVAGAALPACGQTYASNPNGACVTDATACTNGTTYAGSSTTHCRVFCNGTNWVESGMGC